MTYVHGISHKKKKRTGFVLLFYLPVCYMYISTIATYFGFSNILFSLTSQRAGILSAAILLGLAYVIIMRRSIILDQLDKAALLLTLFMFVRGFRLDNTMLSWFSCIALWSLVILINDSVNFSENDSEIVVQLCSITSMIMASIYIVGILRPGRISSVEASNSIYFILCAFPFLLINTNKSVKLLGIATTIVSIMISGKGTCIVAILAIGIYAAMSFPEMVKRNSKRAILIVVGCILLFFAIQRTISALLNDGSLWNTILTVFDEASNGGNGRYNIYSNLLKEYRNSSLVTQIIGHGYNSVSTYLYIGGHNDFLQVLFDYGLIGFILYLLLWRSLLRRWKYYKKGDTPHFAYGVSMIIFFAVSMASNVINSQIQFLFLCTFWGLCRSYYTSVGSTK